MRRSMLEKDPQKKGSFAISLVVNAIAIALIGSITFTYPPSAFFKTRIASRPSASCS